MLVEIGVILGDLETLFVIAYNNYCQVSRSLVTIFTIKSIIT
jgi:hypothetical protein